MRGTSLKHVAVFIEVVAREECGFRLLRINGELGKVHRRQLSEVVHETGRFIHSSFADIFCMFNSPGDVIEHMSINGELYGCFLYCVDVHSAFCIPRREKVFHRINGDDRDGCENRDDAD